MPVGPAKLAAAALAVALTAAACGSDADVTATVAETQTDTAAVADETSNEEAAVGDGDSESDADDGAAADSSESSDTSESTDSATAPPVWLPAEEAEAAAQQNMGSLQSAEDVRDIQVLSVTDGAVSSLREAVTGDRPVLLWFYAPH